MDRKTKRKARKPIYLDDASVAALRSEQGRYVVRDTEITGFRCVVHQHSKLLVYQGEIRSGARREAIYKKLGNPEHVKVAEARARAHDELARLQRISDPDAQAGTTFGEAWANNWKELNRGLKERPEGKSWTDALAAILADKEKKPDTGYLTILLKNSSSGRTIADYQQKFASHLAPSFGAVALRDIKRADVTRLHDRLTKEAGPYAANGVCRVGHAIFRYAALGMEVPEMPALNPFRSYKLFNEEKPRQTGLLKDDLTEWFASVLKLENPVHRELWIMAALTGLRRTDISCMRWENVHKKESFIKIPNPKGGEERAFLCPLTPPMMRSLERAQRAGTAQCDFEKCHPWVFPSVASESGHVVEVKNKKLEHSPHALRHTFRNMCDGAKISKTHSRLLMNHKVSDDVHDEYLTLIGKDLKPGPLFESLRASSAAVSAYIIKQLPKGAEQQLANRLRKQLSGDQAQRAAA